MRQGQKHDRARELRRDMTLAERKLWGVIKNRQLEGSCFRRQHPIGLTSQSSPVWKRD